MSTVDQEWDDSPEAARERARAKRMAAICKGDCFVRCECYDDLIENSGDEDDGDGFEGQDDESPP